VQHFVHCRPANIPEPLQLPQHLLRKISETIGRGRVRGSFLKDSQRLICTTEEPDGKTASKPTYQSSMATLGFRAISQILCVLACALHHQVVIASPSEVTPEPTFPTGWYANLYAPGPATGQDIFWHSLEVGDAPAAVEVIEANIAPASAPLLPIGLQTT